MKFTIWRFLIKKNMNVFSIGLRFDVRFGFGLLNAGALVAAALNWTTVPDKHECRIKAPT